MGMTGLIMMGVSTAFSMYSSITAGHEQRRMFETNARLARYRSDDAIARGEYMETMQRRVTQKTIGQQRTGLAAQHVDVNIGSAVDVTSNTAYLGELDALTIRNNAAKEALGHRLDAITQNMHGINAQQKGYMDATQTLLTGAGNLALASTRYGGTTTTRGPWSGGGDYDPSYWPTMSGEQPGL